MIPKVQKLNKVSVQRIYTANQRWNFLNNFHEISEQQHNDIFEAVQYMVFGTSAYLILFGGALGISHMIGSILKQSFGQSSRVKLTLISGIIFFSALIKTLYHEHLTKYQPFDSPKYSQNTSPLRLIIAGLFVGFGSQLATKDSQIEYGFCGLPFFNFKSVLSHFIFFIVGCLTHTYKLYKFLPSTPRIIDLQLPQNISYNSYLLVFLLIPFICFVVSKSKSFKTLIAYMSLFFIGIIYGYGMSLAGYTQRKEIYNCLQVDDNWNPALVVIYGYGLAAHLVAGIFMKYILKKPMFGISLKIDTIAVKSSLIIGSIIYGIGWGLGGLSPAAVLLLAPLQSIKVVFYWGIPCIIGMKFSHQLFLQPAVEENQITGQASQ